MKRKLIAVMMSALCLAAAVPSVTVMADGQKVVTLGADLTEDQKQAILRYFGVAGQNLQTLTITNQDERDHLGSYVPLEQIGTRTYSCALVSPTTSGGIQVKTANLSWVTSNMIATTLSTSGVVNCDVLAASPFEVSGTGALTGILMAYESAVGTTLDSTKKEVATQELITTTTIANNIGQVEATEIVNDTKIQVIQGNVISDSDIDIIINEAADEQNITLSDEDRDMLAELLQQIAQQEYDYDEMKATLERVEANMEELKQETNVTVIQTEAAAETEAAAAQTETAETLASDSILMNTDDSALGESVVFDATDDSALAETDVTLQDTTEAPSGEFDITSSDSYSENAQEANASETAAADTAETQAEDGGEIIVETQAADVGTAADGGEVSLDQEELPAETAAPEETVSVITADEMTVSPATSEKTGYAVYPAGQNELTISFQRTDIAAGTGSLAVNSMSDGSVVETVNLNDTNRVSIEPLSDEELLNLGWASGCKAVVYLSTPLAQSSSYYVTLTEDAFASADGTAHSEAVTDGGFWNIQTTEFGFAIDKSQSAGIKAGSTVSGQIMMDGTGATYADIENADPSMVTFDVAEFTASGTFSATFGGAGKTSFQVCFYDEAYNLLDSIDYTVTVK